MDLWSGKPRPVAPMVTFARFQAGFLSSEGLNFYDTRRRGFYLMALSTWIHHALQISETRHGTILNFSFKTDLDMFESCHSIFASGVRQGWWFHEHLVGRGKFSQFNHIASDMVVSVWCCVFFCLLTPNHRHLQFQLYLFLPLALRLPFVISSICSDFFFTIFVNFHGKWFHKISDEFCCSTLIATFCSMSSDYLGLGH